MAYVHSHWWNILQAITPWLWNDAKSLINYSTSNHQASSFETETNLTFMYFESYNLHNINKQNSWLQINNKYIGPPMISLKVKDIIWRGLRRYISDDSARRFFYSTDIKFVILTYTYYVFVCDICKHILFFITLPSFFFYEK